MPFIGTDWFGSRTIAHGKLIEYQDKMEKTAFWGVDVP
jgi:hypothetical protein